MNERERLKRIFQPEKKQLEQAGIEVEIVEEKDREPEKIQVRQGNSSIVVPLKALNFISAHPENAEILTQGDSGNV